MEDEPISETYSSIISEFIIIGIDKISHAQRLLTELSYRGEVLLSIPNRWAYGGEFLNRLFAFGFEIPSQRKDPYYFASMINNMSNSVSYIHCYVVYEEITDLMKQAIETMNTTFDLDTNNSLKESAFEKIYDPEHFYITEPTEMNRAQERFFFPTVIAFKSDGVYHHAFRSLLEALYQILKSSCGGENITNNKTGFEEQEDLHLYRMMQFSANLFFLINDLIRPSTSTMLNYKCSLEPNAQFIQFNEKSVLSLPYIEECLLLSVFELEIDSLIFLWKSLILGVNVLVVSECNIKRFNIMEALSFLIFPFSCPPIKIPNFSMRIDSDASKMIIMAGKVFLGLSSKHVDLESLIEEPFLKENYHIIDLDSSIYYPPKASQRPALDIGPFEKELAKKLRCLRSEYLTKIMEISLNPHQDARKELSKIQKETCITIHEMFFEFFEEEDQFMRVEKKYLNLKKVKYLRQHKFILKETNKLIEGFSKPKEFVNEMIYEHTFLNFASELASWGLTSSFRFKNIMAAIECKKLKLLVINPALSLSFCLEDASVLWFFEKIRLIGENNQWGALFNETVNNAISKLSEILKRKKDSSEINYSEKTGIITGKFNLLSFLRKISGRVLNFEDKYEEKDEENLLKQLKSDISLLNFEEILVKDFQKLEAHLPGDLLNITDDPTLELTKHVFLANKALFLFHFSERSARKTNLKEEIAVRKIIFGVLFESYRVYSEFEIKYLAGTIEYQRALDFPDFPRQLFHRLLLGDENKFLKANSIEIKEFMNIMLEINPKSNLMTLLNNRLNFLDSKPNFSDLVLNFPIICYNYLNFLKKSFRSYDFLTLLNTPCCYKLQETAKRKNISKTLNKIKQEYKSDIKNFEEVFVNLQDLTSVHKKHYTDNEKLIFSINFFNLKLIHYLFFHFLIDPAQDFPSSPYYWLDFCEKLKFKLFGLDFSLLDFDISVIRQNLCIQQIFIPKLDFLTQLLSNEEQQLFKKKEIAKEYSFFHRKRIKEEKLINFTFFYAIRDTPIFRIFDDPLELSANFIEHTKEFFSFFKKFNNFHYSNKEKELGVPIPKEIFMTYEEDFGLSKEKKIKFLVKYYDERLKNLNSSKIRLDYVSAKWDEFYLSSNYFA